MHVQAYRVRQAASQINGIKSIVRKAPPKAGNDFRVTVKATAAVGGVGLMLSSVTSTGQTITDHLMLPEISNKVEF